MKSRLPLMANIATLTLVRSRLAVCLPCRLRLRSSALPLTATRTAWPIKRYGQAIQRLSTANLLNSVRAGAIQADAIRTNHIATGEITADRLAIGLGDNLLYNLIFANNAYGRRDINARGGDWSNCPTTKDCKECWRLITLSGTQAQFNTLADRRSWVDVCRQMVNVVAGKWYMASMHVGGFHCTGNLIVEKYSSDEREYQGVVAMTPCSGQSDITQKPNDFIDAYSGHF